MNVTIQWSDIRQSLDWLRHELHETDFDPDVIIAVSNGGIVPAVILRSMLREKPEIELLRVKRKAKEIEATFNWEESKKYLVIDDIFDTGQTWEVIDASLPGSLNWKIAFVYGRDKNIPKENDFYVCNRIRHDHWLDFPWEQHNSNVL